MENVKSILFARLNLGLVFRVRELRNGAAPALFKTNGPPNFLITSIIAQFQLVFVTYSIVLQSNNRDVITLSTTV